MSAGWTGSSALQYTDNTVGTHRGRQGVEDKVNDDRDIIQYKSVSKRSDKSDNFPTKFPRDSNIIPLP